MRRLRYSIGLFLVAGTAPLGAQRTPSAGR
jgi:hypothetical protein